MSAILRYFRDNGVVSLNFLDEKDMRFKGFHDTLNATMNKLLCEGIGTVKKVAQPITPSKEEILWQSGLLGCHSIESMMNTIFYYNCKLFGLRGEDEHRNLSPAQFKLGSDIHGNYLEFFGRGSKNLRGGIKMRKQVPKDLKHYFPKIDDPTRSIETVYTLYLEALKPLGDECPFYQYGKLVDDQLQLSGKPYGRNKLRVMIKTMCEKAGLDGNFTNHSGKKTCATKLFQSNIPEYLIKGRTGHRSTTGLEAYITPSSDQYLELCEVLNPPKKCKSEPEMVTTSMDQAAPQCQAPAQSKTTESQNINVDQSVAPPHTTSVTTVPATVPAGPGLSNEVSVPAGPGHTFSFTININRA